MKEKYIVVAVIAYGLACFASGLWVAPSKVRTETKVVTEASSQSVSQTDTNHNSHVETTVIEVEKSDGTKEKTTHTVQDSETTRKRDTAVASSTEVSQEASKEVERSRPRLTLSALGGVNSMTSTSITPVYGGHLSANVLGPLSTGVWVLSDGTFGVSLGVTF